jgi:hypothetical protein
MSALEDRFWSKVRIGDGCWEWQGGKFDNRYGAIKVAGRQCGAHRVAWELERGPIPNGMCVCHYCDNRACVRPGHLFIGTPADNNADKQAKGRQSRGEDIGGSKMTASAVREIRALVDCGASCRALARRYGVSASTIERIASGSTWSHVQPAPRVCRCHSLRSCICPSSLTGAEARALVAHVARAASARALYPDAKPEALELMAKVLLARARESLNAPPTQGE